MATQKVFDLDSLGSPQSDSLGTSCYASEKGIQSLPSPLSNPFQIDGAGSYHGSFFLDGKLWHIMNNALVNENNTPYAMRIYAGKPADANGYSTSYAPGTLPLAKTISYFTLTNPKISIRTSDTQNNVANQIEFDVKNNIMVCLNDFIFIFMSKINGADALIILKQPYLIGSSLIEYSEKMSFRCMNIASAFVFEVSSYDPHNSIDISSFTKLGSVTWTHKNSADPYRNRQKTKEFYRYHELFLMMDEQDNIILAFYYNGLDGSFNMIGDSRFPSAIDTIGFADGTLEHIYVSGHGTLTTFDLSAYPPIEDLFGNGHPTPSTPAWPAFANLSIGMKLSVYLNELISMWKRVVNTNLFALADGANLTDAWDWMEVSVPGSWKNAYYGGIGRPHLFVQNYYEKQNWDALDWYYAAGTDYASQIQTEGDIRLNGVLGLSYSGGQCFAQMNRLFMTDFNADASFDAKNSYLSEDDFNADMDYHWISPRGTKDGILYIRQWVDGWGLLDIPIAQVSPIGNGGVDTEFLGMSGREGWFAWDDAKGIELRNGANRHYLFDFLPPIDLSNYKEEALFNSIYYTGIGSMDVNLTDRPFVIPTNIANIIKGIYGEQRLIYSIGEKGIETFQISDAGESPLNWVRLEKVYDSLIDWNAVSGWFNMIAKEKSDHYFNGVNRVRKGVIGDGAVLHPSTVIKGIPFDVYHWDNHFWLANRDTQALFRALPEDYIWALSFNKANVNMIEVFANDAGNVRKCDLENNSRYRIEFIHRNPSNALVTDIAIETAQYDSHQNNEPRTFEVCKDGRSHWKRTTCNNLVKFYKLGRGKNSHFEITASGYMKGVAITDTELRQKRQ